MTGILFKLVEMKHIARHKVCQRTPTWACAPIQNADPNPDLSCHDSKTTITFFGLSIQYSKQ